MNNKLDMPTINQPFSQIVGTVVDGPTITTTTTTSSPTAAAYFLPSDHILFRHCHPTVVPTGWIDGLGRVICGK